MVVSGNGTASVDLSSLGEGKITAAVSVTGTAGNTTNGVRSDAPGEPRSLHSQAVEWLKRVLLKT